MINLKKLVDEAEMRRDLEGKMEQVYRRAVAAYEEYEAARVKIESNQELSDIGKLKKIQALADALRAEVEAIRKSSGYDAQISEIEHKLEEFPIDTQESKVIDTLRQVELRAILRDEDPIKIKDLLSGDIDNSAFCLIIRSLESAVFPIVPQEDLGELKRQRNERVNPVLVEALRILKTGKMNLDNFCNMTMNSLIQQGLYDPVADIARGEAS